MGHCRKILGFKIVEPVATFYSDLFAIELAENFHVHFRNLRLELDHVEFEQLATGFARALRAWRRGGRREAQRYEYAKDRFISLHKSAVSPIPSQWNPDTSNDELRVELQQWADYLHLHYRHVKLEFTVAEFMEFAQAIEDARRHLEQELQHEPNPPRLGKFHRANPAGRVVMAADKTTYWTTPPKWSDVTQTPYASSYWDEQDRMRKTDRSRHVSDPRLCWLDISDLYTVTLYHAAPLHPWMVDAQGVCQPLAARYEFVKQAVESGGTLTPDQIRQTAYWTLLCQPLTARPRDGSSDWIYADPGAQCQRFLALIRSMREHGYRGDGNQESLREWDHERRIRVLRNGVAAEILVHKDGGLPGVMTVRPVQGAYCVWNGLHRLAILKYLWDQGCLQTNRVLVRKTTGEPFGPADCAVTPARRPSVGLKAKTVTWLRGVPPVRRVGSRILTRFPRLRNALP